MPANLENSAVATGVKKSVFISIPKKGNAKDCSNYRTVELTSHVSKMMLKILQARLQQYMNQELHKLDLEKTEEPEIKLPTSVGLSKKQESTKETPTSALLTTPKPLTMRITTRDANTRPPELPPEKSVCRSGSNS